MLKSTNNRIDSFLESLDLEYNPINNVVDTNDMRELNRLLVKILNAASAAFKDGDYSNKEFNQIKNAADILNKYYGYED